jgi:L-threonylcarbamoyladenylate synthase
MKTEILRADPHDINAEASRRAIARAAEILRGGGLVAIPTETVYGLAANALDPEAVAHIFTAKGRPQDNPLIVHLADKSWLPRYAREVPPEAERLAAAFWPGPLTMILPKKPIIPEIVSAGLDTAGFRLPSHSVAAAVIAQAGVPLAAPSANLSGSPSPTTAAHVLADLEGRVDAVLDGGSCGVGVESTVVSLKNGVAHVLRPGGITPEQLRGTLGGVEIDQAVLHQLTAGARVASPGMKYKHYAPKAHVIIVDGGLEDFARYVVQRGRAGTCVLCFDGEQDFFSVPCVTYGRSADSASQARSLFGALRRLDEIGAQTVYARCPGKEGVGLAVYNRLLRSAGFEVVTL